ncbi:MAG: ferredoxin [Deltaproteobacteria bacterium]|nr:MAG: ferredoxin [Deltaproteobacteria bacterium]
MKLKIDEAKCSGSGRCVEACPEKAIKIVGGKAVIDYDICDFDGICIPACPNGAIDFDE